MNQKSDLLDLLRPQEARKNASGLIDLWEVSFRRGSKTTIVEDGKKTIFTEIWNHPQTSTMCKMDVLSCVFRFPRASPVG